MAMKASPASKGGAASIYIDKRFKNKYAEAPGFVRVLQLRFVWSCATGDSTCFEFPAAGLSVSQDPESGKKGFFIT
jgi:hypothetical protein